jgi:hypothetical protein
VPADDVFAFATDFSRMPEYLPTVHKVIPTGNNKIRIQGEAAGHPYDVEGWFQTHMNERTMLWGSDGVNRYSGHLEVMSQGNECLLTISMRFEASPGKEEDFAKVMETRKDAIQRELEDSVASIKRACEASMVGVRESRNSGYVS